MVRAKNQRTILRNIFLSRRTHSYEKSEEDVYEKTARSVEGVPLFSPFFFNGVYDLYDRVHSLLSIKLGVVEHYSIVCGNAGGNSACRIVPVALSHLGEHLLVSRIYSFSAKLHKSSASTRFGRSREEDLDLCVGKNNGSYVATVHYNAV